MNFDNIKSLIESTVGNVQIQTISKIGAGKSSEVFLANKTIVFKVQILDMNNISDLEMEYFALSALDGKIKIDIPKPLCFGIAPDGRQILGESFIDGIPFTGDLFEAMDESEKDIILAQVGNITSQIHNANKDIIDGIKIGIPAKSEKHFRDHYTDEVKYKLTDAEKSRLEKICNDFIAIAHDAPITLCHGDTHLWNFNYD